MRFYVSLICLAVAVILSACEKTESIPYVLTTQDTLPYLVKNSDFIAVVNITGGVEGFQGGVPNSIPENVSASVVDVIHSNNNRSPLEINIQNSPHNSEKGNYFTIMALRNGRNLAFLVYQQDGSYKPTTGFSIVSVNGSNMLMPIWKQVESEEEYSKGYSVTSIKNEILSYVQSH